MQHTLNRMGYSMVREDKPDVRRIARLFFLVCVIMPVLSSHSYAAVSDDKIIFDGPFFEKYGHGFADWTGDTEVPSGTLLLKGQLSVTPDTAAPGDEVEFILTLNLSAMSIFGKNGALLPESGESLWTMNLPGTNGEKVNFSVIPDTELFGIGVGSEIPGLILRNTKRTVSVTIPDGVEPGVYPIKASVEGRDLKTNPVNLTIVNKTDPLSADNTNISSLLPVNNSSSASHPILPLENPVNITEIKNVTEFTDKIVNERGLHVTSIYPVLGGIENTMGIKIYGDHFTLPVYVTLVKDEEAIDGYNYYFPDNGNFGVVMIDIPSTAEPGRWNLVVTTKDGKSTIPFELTSKMIAPEIISVEAPVLQPDTPEEIIISGRQFVAPCELYLGSQDISWFSYSSKPVVLHNVVKVKVQIPTPLSDEVTSGPLDLFLWNNDGVTSVYRNAVTFSVPGP